MILRFSLSTKNILNKISTKNCYFFSRSFGLNPLLRIKTDLKPILKTNYILQNLNTSKSIFRFFSIKTALNNSSKNYSSFPKLLKLAKPEATKLTIAIFLLIISSVVTLIVPYGIGRVIDIIYTNSEEDLVESLSSFCKILLLIFIVGALANFGRIYLMQTSGNRIVKRLRETLYGSIIKQEISFFDKNKTGELTNRLSMDTYLVANTLTSNISDGLRSVLQSIGGISWMVYTCPHLAAISLCIVPPVALVTRYYGKFVKNITKEVQDAIAQTTNAAEESISNMKTVQAFVQEEKQKSIYNEKIQKVLEISKKESLARGIFWAGTGFSGNIIVLSVFYYGGLMVSKELITVGELSSFLVYAAFVGISIGGLTSFHSPFPFPSLSPPSPIPLSSFSPPPSLNHSALLGLTSFYSEMMRGLGASERIFNLMERKPRITNTDGIIPEGPIKGKIDFKKVNFFYKTRSESQILKNFDLVLQPGTVTALVGKSGSGKSTVANLLMRFYDPSSGLVTFDGLDLKTLDLYWLRSNISVVSQEPALFSTTIYNNIKYGLNKKNISTINKLKISINPPKKIPRILSSSPFTSFPSELKFKMADEENINIKRLVLESSVKSCSDIFIEKFPMGYDTLVGEKGTMLSGGQKQRIAIARAIIKNPKLLILDEATSALDSENEHFVQEGLKHLMKGRTVLIIAHRLSTIKKSDQICYLGNGQIEESGNFQNLMNIKNGKFRKLMERQMKDEKICNSDGLL